MNWSCPTLCCFSTLNIEPLKDSVVSKASPFSCFGPKASTSSRELIFCICQVSWNRETQAVAHFIAGMLNVL